MASETAQDVDILVVGSGAGGLTAAITADTLGADVMVIEKSDQIGGTSATSGGGIWIPCNHLMAKHGESDSKADAMAYMKACIGDDVSDERMERYVDEAPKMLRFMEENSQVDYIATPYADYFPDRPGGKDGWRTLDPVPFNAGKLGDDFLNLREPHPQTSFGGFTITIPEAQKIITKARGWQWIIAKQAIAYKLDFRMRKKTKRHRRLTGGNALMGRLLKTIKDRDITVWRKAALKSLIETDWRVTGAVLERDGKEIRINARRGIIMAAGGFEHNAEMRSKYLPNPTDPDWSATPGQNTGDGHRAAQDIGAGMSLMDAAWWGPSVRVPGTDRSSVLFAERALPGVYIVNEKGERFLNEAASYDEVGRQLQDYPNTSWIVFDATARKKYAIGPLFPGSIFPDSKWWPQLAEIMKKSDTLDGLAEQMGVDAKGLKATAEKVNGYAKTGEDLDFQKGGNAYDRHYGDRTVAPNPCLGPLEKAPFYAFQIRPGDIGTKGGIDVDVNAQALNKKGKPIGGLYATGNCSSSVMGRTYPGAGSTLGPAMTFGYVAARHAMGANE